MIHPISAFYKDHRTVLKATGVLLIILVAFPLTMLLAGAMVLAAFKINPLHYGAAVYFWAWPDYLNAYLNGELVGQGKRIAVTGGASVLLIYVAIPLLAVLATRQRRELHGSARWATHGEVVKSGLLGNQGIVVGKYRGQTLRFPGQQFVMLAAPTRSGKGVGVVIPNLLSYEESVCVLDIKQENFDITAGYRKDVLKQEIKSKN